MTTILKLQVSSAVSQNTRYAILKFKKLLLKKMFSNIFFKIWYIKLILLKISQKRIRNPVKHLRWCFIRKQFTTFFNKKLHLRCLIEYWIRLYTFPVTSLDIIKCSIFIKYRSKLFWDNAIGEEDRH